ncbi:hypothetical protein LguiB_018724 [Lonicera macranthoides]
MKFSSEENDLYSFPWTGWLCWVFWDDQEQTAQAIVNFEKATLSAKAIIHHLFENDWTGFKNASKKKWSARKSAPSLDIDGWLAHADDYYSEGTIVSKL